MEAAYMNLIGTDTDRTPSPSLWGSCPWSPGVGGATDPRLGQGFFDDFQQTPAAGAAVTVTNIGPYRRFGDTASTITDAALLGGALTFTCANADESTSLGSLVAPYKIVSTTGKLWYECRFKISSIAATTCNVFVGLVGTTAASAVIPITATDDTMADIDFLGFIVKSTGLVDWRYKASGQTVQNPIASIAQLVADTYIKLGFLYDPGAPSANRISAFVNGVKQTTYITGTNIAAATFPSTALLAPILAHTNMATKGTSTYDWHGVFQATA